MSILAKLTDIVGGSLFGEIKDIVKTYLPPDMSPQAKAEYELKVQEQLAKKELEVNNQLNAAAVQLDKRIAEQEGTAKDLKKMPLLGPIMLFLRGAQRPTWGFATLYMDNLWFFGSYTFTQQQETGLIVINTLVLGFLFGERAVANLAPLIARVFGR